MSNSSLIDTTVWCAEGNYTHGRSGRKIEKVTIHHMAGVLSVETCGRIFQQAGRGASANYGVGNDGRRALYVDEYNTSWANSNWDENCKSVTIEISNSYAGGNYPVSDKALRSAIELIADIAKRNGLGRLVKGKNLTWHSMFANTYCPGDYLRSKLDYIVDEANKINYPPTPSKKLYRVQVGAFKSKNNANKLLKELKSKGIDCFIKESSGLYKVQVGAYSVYANAEKMKKKLENMGYKAFISE
jgi:hypothetical protein